VVVLSAYLSGSICRSESWYLHQNRFHYHSLENMASIAFVVPAVAVVEVVLSLLDSRVAP
jgi:hypothetical protein